MKMTKRLLSLLLALVMVISLVAMMSGCSKEDEDSDDEGSSNVDDKKNDDQKQDSTSLVGVWEGEVDMTDLINQEFAADPTMAKYLKVDRFAVILRFSFEEDGSFVMSVDEESVKKAFEDMKDPLATGLLNYLEALIKENGIDMSVDDLLKAQGTTKEEMIDEIMKEMDYKEMVEDTRWEGKWELDGNKLYTYERARDDDEYDEITLTADKLVLEKNHGGNENMPFDFYPLTLTKK